MNQVLPCYAAHQSNEVANLYQHLDDLTSGMMERNCVAAAFNHAPSHLLKARSPLWRRSA